MYWIELLRIFFVIERYDDSIAFDVAISFDNDGRPENFNSIGQMNFALKDDSEAISGISSQAALEAYLKAPNVNDAQTKNLGNIWNTVQRAFYYTSHYSRLGKYDL